MDSEHLPVGPYPGWEMDEPNERSDDDEPQELRSVAESYVLFQSLRQSRNKWLSSALPKFSAKARGGKPPEVVPPPHTIKAYGRYDMKIGPHLFPNTAFYEVYYLPEGPAAQQPVQSSSQYNFSTYRSHQADMSFSATQMAVSAASGGANTQRNVSPDEGVTVTPEMVSQVNAAALANPILKNLLHLAASGKASPEEVKRLGLLVRSLGSVRQQEAGLAGDTSSVQRADSLELSVSPIVSSAPNREYDMVIEFQERPSDRWIIPRGPVICERADPHTLSDVLLSMPFPQSNTLPVGSAAGTKQAEITVTDVSHVITIRIQKVPHTLWDLIHKWSGGEESRVKSKEALGHIAGRTPPRTYLQYRLPDGTLLDQLKTAVAPPYNTKPIMPSNANSSRRRRPTRRTNTNQGHPIGAADSDTPKRKLKSQPTEPNPRPQIACRACGQTDVPLLQGGKYCHTCITAGRATTADSAYRPPSHVVPESIPSAHESIPDPQILQLR